MSATARQLLCAALLAGAAASARAQGSPEAHTRIADRYYQHMAYAQATKEYKRAADLGAVNEHVVKRLADCYMKLGDTEDGEVWYGQVVKFLNREPMDLYMYAQALKGNAKYAEAEKWMDKYLALVPGASPKSNIMEFAKKFTANMDRFTVSPVSINTPLADLCAAWDGEQSVIFMSSRDTTVGMQWRSAWNDKPFLNLYVAKRGSTGDLSGPAPLPGNVNTKLHEGPAVLAPDGSLWYTRSNAQRGKNGIRRLCILHAHRKGDGWSGAEPFLYNNPECSVAHPAISKDGKWFFFASDMPGGFGGTDIYFCKDMGGQWGEPQNLGPGVNTARDEEFPFMAADGTLYYSSSGHPGLGGLDIFAAKRNASGDFPFSINVGAPVNGPKDDFGFIIDDAGKTGYFSSNRPGGHGGDDIYSFTMHYPLEQRFLCTGTVIDDGTAAPVADVEVELLDSAGQVAGSTRSGADGSYSLPVERDKAYSVRARLKGHYDGIVHLSTEDIGLRQIVARDVHLVPEAGIWLRGAAHFKDKLGYVEGVKVSVVNMSSFYSDVHTTGAGGDFLFRMQPNETFEVLLEKPGYFSISVPVSTMGMKQGVIELGQVQDLAIEPVQVGVPVPMKYVTWSGDETALSPTAKAALDQLADRVQVNPALQMEVDVHADTRKTAAAALDLTQQRAVVIGAYLRSKGVPKGRVAVKGLGITKPVNPCGPGVTCTDAQHAANERVEYVVTGVAGS